MYYIYQSLTLHVHFCCLLFQVHHNLFPKMMLFSDVVMFSYYIGRGIQLRHHDTTKHHVQHRTMMFMGFVHAIEGSGQIRFTAWYIWIISRYLPQAIAKLVDTTVCQELSIWHGVYRAAATHCIFPYMIRMNLLRMCTIYFKMLFFRLPMNSRYEDARRFVSGEMFDQAKLFGTSLVAIALMSLVPQSIQDMFNQNLLIIFFYGFQISRRAQIERKWYVIVATISFIIAYFFEGLVDFQDDSYYDDVIFGSITFVFFTFTAREYTSEILKTLKNQKID